MKWRLLLVRGVLGALFIGHGTQKLFGWFGGHGPSGTGHFFEKVGVRPGKPNAVAAGAAEAGGGAMLLLGLWTPLAAAALSSVMITAIRHVHGRKGPWVNEGGYEYNLVMLATIFALSEAGPGPVSLDGTLGRVRCGTAWALAQLAAGAAGSELVDRLAASTPAAGEGDVAAPAPVEPEAPVQTPA